MKSKDEWLWCEQQEDGKLRTTKCWNQSWDLALESAEWRFLLFEVYQCVQKFTKVNLRPCFAEQQRCEKNRRRRVNWGEGKEGVKVCKVESIRHSPSPRFLPNLCPPDLPPAPLTPNPQPTFSNALFLQSCVDPGTVSDGTHNSRVRHNTRKKQFCHPTNLADM